MLESTRGFQTVRVALLGAEGLGRCAAGRGLRAVEWWSLTAAPAASFTSPPLFFLTEFLGINV